MSVHERTKFPSRAADWSLHLPMQKHTDGKHTADQMCKETCSVLEGFYAATL